MDEPECQRCGEAQAVPGGRLCMACALHEASQRRALNTASSLLPLAAIKEKINRRGFITDRKWWWARWGAYTGAMLGLLIAGGSVVFGLVVDFSRNPSSVGVVQLLVCLMTALLVAAVGALFGAASGALLGAAAGNIFSFFRAIFIALFLKPSHFEREYGPVKRPK